MSNLSNLDVVAANAPGISRADLLDTLGWLRSIYPPVVGHDLDDEGIAAWLSDAYVRARRLGDSHQEAKDRVFAHIWAVVHNEPEPPWEVPVPPAPPAPTPLPAPAFARLSVSGGRLVRDGQPFALHAISEFSAAHLCRTNQESEFIRRLSRAHANGLNAIRVLSMADILFRLNPRQTGYWAALERVVRLSAERSMYVCLDAFADAQIVMPNVAEQRDFLTDWAAFVVAHTNVLPNLTNEARKNGWSEADDPALLQLAAQFKSKAPGIAFSISDPLDGDTLEESAETTRILKMLAGLAPIAVLHPSRKEDITIWRRWLNHERGFAEVDLGGCFKFVQEPMGAASTRQPGRRDNDPEAQLAGACIAAVCQMGYCYHYISEQDDAVPGLNLLHFANLIPQRAGMSPRNAGTAGAPVGAFTGFDKIRCCTDGREAWAVGYGPDVWDGRAEWLGNWRPIEVYRGAHVVLWRAS
jgi:hypothetical protein